MRTIREDRMITGLDIMDTVFFLREQLKIVNQPLEHQERIRELIHSYSEILNTIEIDLNGI